MTDHCPGCPWTGETPDDATEPAPVSAGQRAKLASADNPLRVDHVRPVALGGTDDPTVMADAAFAASHNKGVMDRSAYFAAICWKRLRAMQEIAEQIVAGDDAP